MDFLEGFIFGLLRDEKFIDSLYIASPNLYKEIKKSLIKQKISYSLKYSVLKYYLRSISNTVPFGLFTTYKINKFDKQSYSKKKGEFIRYTNIDLDYLTLLISHINKINIVRNIVKYRNNDTIYRIGKAYRFIDSSIINKKLNYTLSSIDYNEVIELILQENEGNSSTINQLSNIIVRNVDGVSKQDAESFIDDLINSGLILSSFQINLNGEAPLTQIINFFEENNLQLENNIELKNIYYSLTEIDQKIKTIDKNIFNSEEIYNQIFLLLDNIGIEYDIQKVINSNLKKIDDTMPINSLFEKNIYKTINLLQTLSSGNSKNINSNLENFKNRFYNRYESKEISILEIMDNEIGLGYLEKYSHHASFSELIDDISMSEPISDTYELKINKKIFEFWHKLIINRNNNTEIDLEKTDFLKIYDSEKKNSFGTFTLCCNEVNGKIVVKSLGGTSSTNLISRFSCNDPEMESEIKKILDIEKSLFQNCNIAEVNHMPNNRVGNVLLRKIDRDYEINILSNNKDNQKSIKLENIGVSIVNDKIILRCKKTNKEIIPFLSSAQNFHFDSLPVYQFLCDLQDQYRSNNYSINFGGLDLSFFNYVPRIVFGEKIILIPATWFLNKNNMLSDPKGKIDLESFNEFKSKFNIPKYVFITEFNEDKLLIDTENPVTLEILIQEINLKENVIIKECVYNIEKGNDINEQLFFLYQDKKFVSNISDSKVFTKKNNIKRKFIPGEDWLYIKIYTGHATANKIVFDFFAKVQKLVGRGIIEKWFFIRYNDPDFHLRLRIKFHKHENLGEVIKEIKNNLRKYTNSSLVWKVEYGTYERELERYYGNNIDRAENIFFWDSIFAMKILKLLKEENSLDKVWLYTIKAIDDYFSAFQINLELKYSICLSLYNSFSNEFNISKEVKSQIDKKYRKEIFNIQQVLEQTPRPFNILFKKRYNNISEENNNKIKSPDIEYLLKSYIHMTVNRLVISNPRFHELVIYSFLEKYYRGKLGFLKNN